MRALLDELDQLRAYGSFLNPEAVENLSVASNTLGHLNLEQNATTLLMAAQKAESARLTLENLNDSLTATVARLEYLRGQEW